MSLQALLMMIIVMATVSAFTLYFLIKVYRKQHGKPTKEDRDI